MEISSFQSYLLILFVVLIIISIFVFRQFLKTRTEELNLVLVMKREIQPKNMFKSANLSFIS